MRSSSTSMSRERFEKTPIRWASTYRGDSSMQASQVPGPDNANPGSRRRHFVCSRKRILSNEAPLRPLDEIDQIAYLGHITELLFESQQSLIDLQFRSDQDPVRLLEGVDRLFRKTFPSQTDRVGAGGLGGAGAEGLGGGEGS